MTIFCDRPWGGTRFLCHQYHNHHSNYLVRKILQKHYRNNDQHNWNLSMSLTIILVIAEQIYNTSRTLSRLLKKCYPTIKAVERLIEATQLYSIPCHRTEKLVVCTIFRHIFELCPNDSNSWQQCAELPSSRLSEFSYTNGWAVTSLTCMRLTIRTKSRGPSIAFQVAHNLGAEMGLEHLVIKAYILI